jgi:hypothetical protein
MSEYWKSTPSYWCKFCSQYVRDTGIERKNHEASAKHQNNIQRSLRELHKGKEREERDKKRAKDEVARLNGIFGGAGGETKATSLPATGPKPNSQPPAPIVASAQARVKQAEQLAALGVELPEELKKEITGVGSYEVINAREVDDAGTVSVNRSLADIMAEARREEQENLAKVKAEEEDEATSKGVHKRKAEDDEDIRDEEAAPKRKAWGSNIKRYPGVLDASDDGQDLDALLGSVKKREPKVESTRSGEVKVEEDGSQTNTLSAVPPLDASDAAQVKQENGAGGPPAVIFKKRKGKK